MYFSFMGVLKSFDTFWNPLAVEFLNNLFLIYSYFFRIFLLWGVWKKYSKNQKPLALEFFHLLFYFFIFKIINWIFSSVCFWKLFKTPISIIFCRIKFYLKYPYVDLILIEALPLSPTASDRLTNVETPAMVNKVES